MKIISAFVILLVALPIVFATHTDIPYYSYDSNSRPVYSYGTDSRYDTPQYYPYASSPRYYYDAGYRQGKLYEREGFTREYEIRGEDRDAYGYSQVNDRYKEKESYERTIEYDYNQNGRFYTRYDPRYDGRRSRTLSRDYDDGYYRPSLYGSGRIAIENEYGPVYYNYRGQRYGYDKEGRRFYY